MSNRHTLTFTALPEHIDELGHVNNTVWLQWVQELATSHWNAVADPAHRDAFVWMVTRHEIDYRGNIGAGESVTATTFIPEGPRGARFDRCVEFRNASGKVIVAARSTWAMLDRESGRLVRVREDVAAPFAPFGSPAD
ncbi:MAG: acyl-CoA thioesterase [Sphingomonadales bacterium]|nr:acyl-CoA thioesterase [Sphingomonadales bacterium]MBD3773102.1 acyl-CoA thioesterase [Paracoccaceae bacterium]